MENYDTDSIDVVLYVSGARLIKSRVLSTDIRDNLVTFVNAGGGAIKKGDSSVDLELDCYFEGGEQNAKEEDKTTLNCRCPLPSQSVPPLSPSFTANDAIVHSLSL
ncbi:hypothetical protein Patl1_32057 [Pistacia atlantica]|uniref:Uncharacterized protein n=1 Tax=Pistacia atlantica TaxID=434234 RepID=A0ACC1AM98_9ROSI|nr:hypothetical protein Patl1_32057 [Pistacia atlantica]